MVIKEDASPCPKGFSQLKDDGELNILLRRDQKKQPTKIDAIALTQEKIFDSRL